MAESVTGYAIEWCLDASLSREMEQVWQRLITAAGTSFIADVGGEPHVSLATLPRMESPDAVIEAVGQIARPLEVTFTAVGGFQGAGGVVFALPTPTEALLRTHAEVHALLAERGLQAHEYYRPGRWVPHCTLAMEVPRDRLGDAMVAAQACLPLSGEMVALQVIRYRPVEVLARFEPPRTT